MNGHWEVLPKLGIGPLRFGMPEAAVRAVALARFGAIEAEGTLGFAGNDDVYRILLETMGEEAAAEAMRAIAQSNVKVEPKRRVNFLSGLMLDFVEDQLDSIMCHSAARDLHSGESRFFGTDPLPALRQLQRLNGAPPLVKGPDCYFPAIEVTAFECLIALPGGGYRATREGTEEAAQKTIGWQRGQRTPVAELADHVPLDLLV